MVRLQGLLHQSHHRNQEGKLTWLTRCQYLLLKDVKPVSVPKTNTITIAFVLGHFLDMPGVRDYLEDDCEPSKVSLQFLFDVSLVFEFQDLPYLAPSALPSFPGPKAQGQLQLQTLLLLASPGE